MEKYQGVKFEIVDEKQSINHSDVKKFLKIDRALRKFLRPKENEGNLSIRIAGGFLIKRSGARMTKLKKNDVVRVHKATGKQVFCSGGTPSSESRMHQDIYKNVPSVNVILHFHCDRLLGVLSMRNIGSFAYGSIALARAVGTAAMKNNIIQIARHGFVITGADENEVFMSLEQILSAKEEGD